MLTKRSLLAILAPLPDGARVYMTLDADGEQVRPIEEVRIDPPTDCRPAHRAVLLPSYKRDEWGLS